MQKPLASQMTCQGLFVLLFFLFVLFLLFQQFFPLVKEFLLVEAGVLQFVTGVPQEDVVAQHLRVIDGVFQFLFRNL